MSTLLSVPPRAWRGLFDGLSKALLGYWAEIEVASLDGGDQIVAERVPLLGITYDSGDDVLDVALTRSDHLILHPRAIVLEETQAGFVSVAVVDGDGARQIVRWTQPRMLPPAPPLLLDP
jgi:Family of unknown function (DUF5335)